MMNRYYMRTAKVLGGLVLAVVLSACISPQPYDQSVYHGGYYYYPPQQHGYAQNRGYGPYHGAYHRGYVPYEVGYTSGGSGGGGERSVSFTSSD